MRITIIAATNRPDSRSEEVAVFYQTLLSEINLNAEVVTLRQLPSDLLSSAQYITKTEHLAFKEVQLLVDQTDFFVFIIPEYNGSFPGVLKVFVDALRYPDSFVNKRGAMVGISSGTQGAALAMSHFGDVLSYMGMTITPIRPRISQIHQHLANGVITNNVYIGLLKEQIAASFGNTIFDTKSQLLS